MSVNHLKSITYSPAFTLVPTNECFNRCTYCNFRRDPEAAEWLSLDVARNKLIALLNSNICEILILSGEVHPNSHRRSAWFEHIYQICKLALEYDFLPHTNVGPLNSEEMKRLQSVNVSMGLMLEQITPTLLKTVHKQAPSKEPSQRIQQLHQAGALGIPFTTGLLLGIGESTQDWQDTLEAIAHIHQQWGHIQEVILQPYHPGNSELKNTQAFPMEKLLTVITLANEILPNTIALQIPPNLVNTNADLRACLEAGITDLGGIGPKDHVNPDYPHATLSNLSNSLNSWGYQLTRRLPVYPHLESKVPQSLMPRLAFWKHEIQEVSIDRK